MSDQHIVIPEGWLDPRFRGGEPSPVVSEWFPTVGMPPGAPAVPGGGRPAGVAGMVRAGEMAAPIPAPVTTPGGLIAAGPRGRASVYRKPSGSSPDGPLIHAADAWMSSLNSGAPVPELAFMHRNFPPPPPFLRPSPLDYFNERRKKLGRIPMPGTSSTNLWGWLREWAQNEEKVSPIAYRFRVAVRKFNENLEAISRVRLRWVRLSRSLDGDGHFALADIMTEVGEKMVSADGSLTSMGRTAHQYMAKAAGGHPDAEAIKWLEKRVGVATKALEEKEELMSKAQGILDSALLD